LVYYPSDYIPKKEKYNRVLYEEYLEKSRYNQFKQIYRTKIGLILFGAC
jgi:hypothetical protein